MLCWRRPASYFPALCSCKVNVAFFMVQAQSLVYSQNPAAKQFVESKSIRGQKLSPTSGLASPDYSCHSGHRPVPGCRLSPRFTRKSPELKDGGVTLVRGREGALEGASREAKHGT